MRRAVSSTLVLLLLFSVLSPTAQAAGQPAYGDAGSVMSPDGAALGWWDVGDNTSLVINKSGGLSTWQLAGEQAGTLVWQHDLNRSLLAASLMMDESRDLVALANASGVVIFSLQWGTSTYNIPVGEAVDSVVWDAAGDLWMTLRSSRIAAQYHDGTATGLQTTAHSIGISEVLVLSSGEVITGGRDKQIRVHDELAQFDRVLSQPGSDITGLWQDSDGDMHALTKDGQHIVYETVNWTVKHDSVISAHRLTSISDVGGDRLLLGSNNGRAHLINSTDHSVIQTLQAAGDVVGTRSLGDSGLLTLSAFISSSRVTLWDIDSDDDGVVNTHDAFPDDGTQTKDTDGDGHGDEANGNDGDAFPNDASQWQDRDGDGYGDDANGTDADAFPDNDEQHVDSDGDGYGDSIYGRDGDRFPTDPTQWADRDGDGYGDEPDEEFSDACPDKGGHSHEDRLGCPDFDGDGWSDPDNGWPIDPVGGADGFWQEPTQWRDSDHDGYGDNMSGSQGDQCPGTPIGVNVSTRAIIYDVDSERARTVAMYGCTDADGDNYADDSEAWWEPSNCPGTLVANPLEWLDFDRDCVGSNSDYDDTDSSVKTIADWCEDNINNSACAEYQKADEPIVDPPVETTSRGDAMLSSLKEFAIIGVVVAVGMVAILLLVQGLAGMVRASKAKSEDDEEYSAGDATSEIESGKSRSVGGIIDEGGWDDEVAPLQMTASLDDLVVGLGLIGAEEGESAAEEGEADAPEGVQDVPLTDGAGQVTSPTSDAAEAVPQDGEWQQGQAGWQHYEQHDADPAATAETPATPAADPDPADADPEAAADPSPTAAAQPAAAEQPPAEAPPIPSTGLPEGWTEDQWRWYGHEWLQKQDGK